VILWTNCASSKDPKRKASHKNRVFPEAHPFRGAAEKTADRETERRLKKEESFLKRDLKSIKTKLIPHISMLQASGSKKGIQRRKDGKEAVTMSRAYAVEPKRKWGAHGGRFEKKTPSDDHSGRREEGSKVR